MARFDIPTIYLLTGFSSLIASSVLLWLRGDHRGPALTLFAGGTLLLGVGFVCFALREEIGNSLGPLLGYTCFGSSVILYWLGSARMFDGRARDKAGLAWLLAFVAAVLTIAGASASEALARIVLSSVFMIAFLVLSALHAHRSRWLKTLRSVRLLRNLMLGYALFVAVRLVAFLLQNIPLQGDGSAAPGTLRVLFALISGSVPFAMTVVALSITNSQLSIELRRLATTDDLTGLVSRRSLHEAARHMLEQASTNGCVAVLMIDLDDFKAVNDRHGHTLGDEVLRHVAQVLRRVLRDESLIVRYGGDEFCALVPVGSEAAAFVVAERLRVAVEASPYRCGREAIPVTLSIGVTVHRTGATLRQLFDEADRRAYRAKAGGRNRVVGDDPIAEPVV